ncbi:hypothetical protein E2C01_037356 [Portunus trituberculatus]|uniref:Uncharacterized protein n=1 Tax=Portunus trituberculatus TaxID=210409 RepID=A0A5B7FGW3_PORTR|nr:hypothetical protein [Portunus trituberculatus]
MLIGLILQVTRNWLQALSDYTRASAGQPSRRGRKGGSHTLACRSTPAHPCSSSTMPFLLCVPENFANTSSLLHDSYLRSSNPIV